MRKKLGDELPLVTCYPILAKAINSSQRVNWNWISFQPIWHPSRREMRAFSVGQIGTKDWWSKFWSTTNLIIGSLWMLPHTNANWWKSESFHPSITTSMSCNQTFLILLYYISTAQCLEINQKVSLNIASEASYVYILSRQKVKQCYQTGQF